MLYFGSLKNTACFSYLFYASDEGYGTRVSRCNMAATNCIIVAEGPDQNHVASLLVDPIENNLYWISETSEQESVIFTSTLDGDNLAIIYTRYAVKRRCICN